MRLRLTLGSFAAALLLAACGGDDDAPIEPIGETTTGEEADAAVSKGDYLAGADPSCAEANAAIANLANTTGDNIELAASQELQITEGVLTALEGLEEPSDPDGSLEDYLDALAEQVSILEQRQQAAASGDTAAYEALGTELAAAKADAATAAEEFGFEDCGQEGTATTPTDTVPGTDAGTGGTAVPTEPAPTTPAPAPAPAPEPAPAPAPTGGTGTGGDTGGGDTGGSSGGVGPG